MLPPDLVAFFTDSAALPFVFGERDCALWVCDWIVRRRGIDPGAALRGRYRTKLGCARLVNRNGGLLALSSAHFAAAGLRETPAPAPGDVGCIVTPVGPAMAIRGRDNWVWKPETALIAMPAECLRAWSL